MTFPGLNWIAGKLGGFEWIESPFAEQPTDVVAAKRDPSDASVGTGNFTQGVPAFWFARSVDYGVAEQLFNPYANSPWVQRAIKHISGPIAGVEVEFHEVSSQQSVASSKHILARSADPKLRTTDYGLRTRPRKRYTARGIVRRDPADALDLPNVRDWMREPMRGLSWSDFVEASVGWLKISECFWLLSDEVLVPHPDALKTLPPIIVARPDRMRPIIDRDRSRLKGGHHASPIVGWTYTDSQGGSWNLLPEQVIHFRGWNPYNEYRGLGEYESAHIAAEADWLAGKFSRNLMGSNGDTGPFIIAKNGMPTDPQREQILMDLRAKRKGTLRGEFRPTFLTGDIQVEDPKIKNVDRAFVMQRLENRHEVAIAFGVPPSLFDVKAAYSIGSASDYFQLILNTCIPTGAKFCDALERLLLRLAGVTVEVSLDWDRHPVMQAVRKESLDAIGTLAAQGMPMREINEYLELGLPAYEGWEVGYVPTTVKPVGAGGMTNDQVPNDQGNPNDQENQDIEKMLIALGNPQQAASQKLL